MTGPSMMKTKGATLNITLRNWRIFILWEIFLTLGYFYSIMMIFCTVLFYFSVKYMILLDV